MVSPSLSRTAIKLTAPCEPLGIGPGVAVFVSPTALILQSLPFRRRHTPHAGSCTDRRPVCRTLAVRSAILAARRRRTIATRMRTLFNFLLGHKTPLAAFHLAQSILPPTPHSNPSTF